MKVWAIVVFSCVMAGMLAAHTVAAQGGVLIHRGAETEVLGNAAKVRGVELDRGEAPARKASPAPYPQTATTAPQLSSGQNLWIVDEGGKRVKACRLAVTTQIGERVIRCFDRQVLYGRP